MSLKNVGRLVLVLLFLMGAFQTMAREFTQTGIAMLPTLKPGQKVEAGLFSALFYQPARWDLVAVKNPRQSNLLIFRIVGMPGERIRIDDDGVSVNGQRLQLPDTLKQAGVEYLPAKEVVARPEHSEPVYITGEHEYFLLGDNSKVADDSRFSLGVVSYDEIFNKVTIVKELQTPDEAH